MSFKADGPAAGLDICGPRPARCSFHDGLDRGLWDRLSLWFRVLAVGIGFIFDGASFVGLGFALHGIQSSQASASV